MNVQPIHFLRPPKKDYTSTFFRTKNPHENNKNPAKKLKVYSKNVPPPPPPPPKGDDLPIWEKVNIYRLEIETFSKHVCNFIQIYVDK